MDLEMARGLLGINKSRLDSELEIQPETQWRISEARARAEKRRDEMKDELARVEAAAAEDLRSRYEKITVEGVKGRVATDVKRIRAFENYQQAKMEADDWLYMYEAWKARGFALKSLCDLYASDYFSVSAHTPRGERGSERGYARPVRPERNAAPEIKPVVRRRVAAD